MSRPTCPAHNGGMSTVSKLAPAQPDFPSVDELLERARIVSIPLTTRFRGITTREAVLIEGPCAWSEFSPFVEYESTEAANWLAAAIEYAFDATLPRRTSGTVPVNATIPAIAATQVAALAHRYAGCSTVKVKVAERGQALHEDIERLLAVRDAFPHAAVRIDANGAWSPVEAEHAIRELHAAGIELQYAEQPCATVPELAHLRHRIRDLGTRIAADESIRKADDPLAVARAGAADHAVVKVQPLGGVRRATEIVRGSGLTATVSSALETSVGLVTGAQLASTLAESDAPFAAGLATLALFADDVCAQPRLPVDGSISLAPAVPDASKLRSLAASGDRQDWWLQRIRDCYRVLAAQH